MLYLGIQIRLWIDQLENTIIKCLVLNRTIIVQGPYFIIENTLIVAGNYMAVAEKCINYKIILSLMTDMLSVSDGICHIWNRRIYTC